MTTSTAIADCARVQSMLATWWFTWQQGWVEERWQCFVAFRSSTGRRRWRAGCRWCRTVRRNWTAAGQSACRRRRRTTTQTRWEQRQQHTGNTHHPCRCCYALLDNRRCIRLQPSSFVRLAYTISEFTLDTSTRQNYYSHRVNSLTTRTKLVAVVCCAENRCATATNSTSSRMKSRSCWIVCYATKPQSSSSCSFR